MLSTALLPLKQDIFKAIQDPKVAEAFTRALLSTMPKESQENKQFFEMAENFGKIAAMYLAQPLSDKIGDAIDKYVKQIEFVITPTKLVSPIGPVTGVINSKPDIQIL